MKEIDRIPTTIEDVPAELIPLMRPLVEYYTRKGARDGAILIQFSRDFITDETRLDGAFLGEVVGANDT